MITAINSVLMCTVKFLTLAKSCSISRAIVSNMCSPLSNGTVSALQMNKNVYNDDKLAQ